jgi:predicted Rossmann fold flavoprotein
MLQQECDDAGVSIVTDCEITSVEFDGSYHVQAADHYVAESLVVATGGLSIPKMGASDFGYRLARQFDLEVLPTRAGLVPFTFTGPMHDVTTRLSGVSVAASLVVAGQSFTDDALFTHRGLSGPAALQISSYWHPGDELLVDLLPGIDAAALLLDAKRNKPGVLLRTMLAEHLPKALVQELQYLHWSEAEARPLSEFADSDLRHIASSLQQWRVKPAATEGYRTAEVTLGGINTDALSSKTMECKSQPRLYCIGEVVDVTGHLGGFNFQWAWASGHAAGEVA